MPSGDSFGWAGEMIGTSSGASALLAAARHLKGLHPSRRRSQPGKLIRSTLAGPDSARENAELPSGNGAALRPTLQK